MKLLDLLAPISGITLKEAQRSNRYDLDSIWEKSQNEFLLFFNLITENTVQLPKDFISKDFKIKNLESLISFLTFKDISVSNFQNLAKTLLNIKINSEQSQTIINFLKNNFEAESDDFGNFLKEIQQMLNFLSEKLENFSEEEKKNVKEFLKDRKCVEKEDKNFAENAIIIIEKGNKDELIEKTNKCIEITNEIIKNSLNILKFVDPKKLYSLTENQNDELRAGAMYFASLFNSEANGSIQNLVNAINIIGIDHQITENVIGVKTKNKSSSNKKKYIIYGLIVTAVVVCGAIWYWEFNQTSNFEI